MSNETKRYRLLKDLPECESGNIFIEYTSDNRRYYYCVVNGKNWETGYTAELVENNPEWFELIPEQSKELHNGSEEVVISHFRNHDNFKGNGVDAFWYQFCSSKLISQDRISAIYKAIESCLNSPKTLNGELDTKPQEKAEYAGSISKDKFWLSTHYDIKEVKVDGKKYLSPSEVDTIREETWKAARLVHPLVGMKFPTLQDYLNSIKENGYLYCTEDNWHVYEKDTFPIYKVDASWNILMFAACDANGSDKNFKYFFSKDKAEKYISENKPSPGTLREGNEYIEISYRRIKGKNITKENTFMFIPAEIFEETKAAINNVFMKHYPKPQSPEAITNTVKDNSDVENLMNYGFNLGIDMAIGIIKTKYQTIKDIGEEEKYHNILNTVVINLTNLKK